VECSQRWVAKAGEGLEEDQGWSRAGNGGYGGVWPEAGVLRPGNMSVAEVGWASSGWNLISGSSVESESLKVWVWERVHVRSGGLSPVYTTGHTEVHLKYYPEETNTSIPC